MTRDHIARIINAARQSFLAIGRGRPSNAWMFDAADQILALSTPEPTEGLRATLLNIQAMAERGFRIDNAKLSEQCKHALRAMPLQDHGWQPINTAPKDGSVIQLFVPDDDDGDVVWPAHWTLPAAKNHLGAWKHCAAGRWVAEDSDQRWRPLAAPPMLAEEGTKS